MEYLLKELLSIIIVIFCPLSRGDFLSSTSPIINVVRNISPLSVI